MVFRNSGVLEIRMGILKKKNGDLVSFIALGLEATASPNARRFRVWCLGPCYFLNPPIQMRPHKRLPAPSSFNPPKLNKPKPRL